MGASSPGFHVNLKDRESTGSVSETATINSVVPEGLGGLAAAVAGAGEDDPDGVADCGALCACSGVGVGLPYRSVGRLGSLLSACASGVTAGGAAGLGETVAEGEGSLAGRCSTGRSSLLR